MEPTETLRLLEQKIQLLAARIEAPGYLLPSYGRSHDFAQPHLEIDSRGLHYVVVERGQELNRRTTQSADELLYWVFESVTFNMASSYEMRHRVPNQDFRRILWQEQLRLLQLISSDWVERCAMHIDQVLQTYPHEDELPD